MRTSNSLKMLIKTNLFVTLVVSIINNSLYAAESISTVKPIYSRPLMLASFLEDEKRPQPQNWVFKEAAQDSWAFYLDNDILALGQNDRDYTGGLSLTLSGVAATQNILSIDSVLGAVNGWSGVGKRTDKTLRSVEMGMTAFTPENIMETEALADDRPYASLLYVSNTRQYIDLTNKSSIITSLTLGVLGLNVAAEFQSKIHKVLDSRQAQGWNHQIAEGGEATFRYSVAKQKVRWSNYSREGFDYEIKTARQISVGYLTEASWSISGRFGKLRSPWSSFNPQNVTYSEKNLPVASGSGKSKNEFYLWAGYSMHARAYNVLLQGQFRSSDVTYASGELKYIVNEAWLGLTREFDNGMRLSYFLRGQSAEIKSGSGSRNPVWGGIIISHSG